MKWRTYTSYVDKETGEQISQETAKIHYRIIKKNKYVTQPKRNESFRIIYITYICSRNRTKQITIGFKRTG